VVLALVLRDRGWRVTFLGADTPIETITDTSRRLGPEVVVLAMLTAPEIEAAAVRELSGRSRVVIAGDAVVDGCVTAVEPEPFGGPVSGIAAALPHTHAERVLVVACDHPFLDSAVSLLTEAQPGRDGVIAIDSSGRRQNLLTCLDRQPLAVALAVFDSPVGVSMRQLLAALDVREIVVDDRAAFDVDTWDDVARGRELDESEVTDHD
jgi:molybdopterin-guanine dinucleotide biosynthesis protein A